MNKKLIFALAAAAVVCGVAFQNCSGSLNSSSNGSAAPQTSTSQSDLASAQAMYSNAMKDPGTNADQLKATIQSLQTLLQQLQAMGMSKMSADVKQAFQQLIQQIQTEITNLQAQLANLNPNDCLFNGQTVANGSNVTAYQTQTVPNGETCQSQTRTCTNGQLSGTYTFASCSASSAALTATYSPNPAYVGNAISISVSGGTPPYTYSKLSGAGVLNSNVYSAPATAETASITITDMQGASFSLTVAILAPQAKCDMQPVDTVEVWWSPAFCAPAYPQAFPATSHGTFQTVTECEQQCISAGSGRNCLYMVLTSNHPGECYSCPSGTAVSMYGAGMASKYGLQGNCQ